MKRFRTFVLGATVLVGCVSSGVLKLALIGDSRELRERTDDAAAPRDSSSLLVIGLDGVNRSILYDLLRGGDLPGLASLLGGRQGRRFPHAHLDESTLSPLPSLTIPGWATIFTGVTPAEHGIAGNEFFVRETMRFAAPLPGTFVDETPVHATYTDDYANRLLEVPSVYDRMRAAEPDIRIWVSVSPFYAGADRLLLAERSAAVDMTQSFFETTIDRDELGKYEWRDREIFDTVIEHLEGSRGSPPDVLTLYVSGTDQYAHVAPEGPERAIRRYLQGAVDDMFGELQKELDAAHALDDRYVVVVADHGHTEVVADQEHLIGVDGEDDPPVVLRAAGFRLRPFELETGDDDFQAVLTYQGPFAYVYVADRSTCAEEGQRCRWHEPPRFEEDVLPVAEAFFRASEAGTNAPGMKGTLDMVLARRPRPYGERDLPFEVYVGNGRLQPISRYLESHPNPRYVAFEERLRDLAVGRYGERAGDVMLLAHDGDRDRPEDRYYFATTPYRSVHGSPSRRDSEIPLILAHRGKTTAALRRLVERRLGQNGRADEIAALLLDLRRDRSLRK